MGEEDKKTGEDVAFLGPPAEGGGVHVVRHRPDHTWEAGVLRDVEDGRPLHGELVRLTQRDGPGYSVETLHGRGEGPAMVNSQAYKDGWENIFGQKVPAGEA